MIFATGKSPGQFETYKSSRRRVAKVSYRSEQCSRGKRPFEVRTPNSERQIRIRFNSSCIHFLIDVCGIASYLVMGKILQISCPRNETASNGYSRFPEDSESKIAVVDSKTTTSDFEMDVSDSDLTVSESETVVLDSERTGKQTGMKIQPDSKQIALHALFSSVTRKVLVHSTNCLVTVLVC